MNKLSLFISFACITLLTSCLIPERFSAKVDIQPDASYSFEYTGTVVNALAVMQIKKTGTISDKDQANLKKAAEQLSKQPYVQKIVYKGDGRYDLNIVSKKHAGKPLSMFDIFNVSTDKNGIITIASKEMKEKGKRDLESLGIAVDGTLKVSLPKNVEILTHNADSTPSFLGMVGTYTWKIGNVGQRPIMKIRLKP